MVFSQFLTVHLPESVDAGEGFFVDVSADGTIPFPQIIVRPSQGGEYLVRDEQVQTLGGGEYRFAIPGESVAPGRLSLQIEGCQREDIDQAGSEDWIKTYREIVVTRRTPRPRPVVSAGDGNAPVIYFGIHKHMHQPYYDAVDPDYWDGQIDGIFGERGGPYTDFIPAAIRHYADGGLPHAGLSASWSGSLVEQLDRCRTAGRTGGRFQDWDAGLRAVAELKTARGQPRLEFSAFGHCHPLMPLIPHRDIVAQIQWHRTLVRTQFGTEATNHLFPPETAFAPHMIPALKEAGIEAVIYDSIHRFRATQGYPYAGIEEGMLPPNPADQLNPPVDDWLQLNGIWAPSKISPRLLRPSWLTYTDADGTTHRIIGIPAERYLGNEDARGGYGALQYEDVMGQIYDQIVATGSYDPANPPFFLLHSDGDNHGGGSDSYYTVNTERLVEWLREDPRFELTTVTDYLERFPPPDDEVSHVEAGSWAGADNGDPQFGKWFSWEEREYSPDLNSWAVLTAAQNAVHSVEDASLLHGETRQTVKRLLYTAEASDYWYWTGQSGWDIQVTRAANAIFERLEGPLRELEQKGRDRTGPGIFLPWIRPANPGGKTWGQGCLLDAPRQATARTFVFDVVGIAQVEFQYWGEGDDEPHRVAMSDQGPYPSHTNPRTTASAYALTLPGGLGTIRYRVEAIDRLGNRSASPIARIHLA